MRTSLLRRYKIGTPAPALAAADAPRGTREERRGEERRGRRGGGGEGGRRRRRRQEERGDLGSNRLGKVRHRHECHGGPTAQLHRTTICVAVSRCRVPPPPVAFACCSNVLSHQSSSPLLLSSPLSSSPRYSSPRYSFTSSSHLGQRSVLSLHLPTPPRAPTRIQARPLTPYLSACLAATRGGSSSLPVPSLLLSLSPLLLEPSYALTQPPRAAATCRAQSSEYGGWRVWLRLRWRQSLLLWRWWRWLRRWQGQRWHQEATRRGPNGTQPCSSDGGGSSQGGTQQLRQ